MSTRANNATESFYRWEIPLRGWNLNSYPVEIEPPSIPFWHYCQPSNAVDDGKVKNLLSRLINLMETKKELPQENEDPIPEEDPQQILTTIQVSLPRENQIDSFSFEEILKCLTSSVGIVAFEVIAKSNRIIIQFTANRTDISSLTFQLESIYPNIDTKIVTSDLQLDQEEIAIVDFGLEQEVKAFTIILK